MSGFTFFQRIETTQQIKTLNTDTADVKGGPSKVDKICFKFSASAATMYQYFMLFGPMVNSNSAKAPLEGFVIRKLVISDPKRVVNMKQTSNQLMCQILINKPHIFPSILCSYPLGCFYPLEIFCLSIIQKSPDPSPERTPDAASQSPQARWLHQGQR